MERDRAAAGGGATLTRNRTLTLNRTPYVSYREFQTAIKREQRAMGKPQGKAAAVHVEKSWLG